MAELSVDTSSFRVYAAARRQFLEETTCANSCRDPLAEFSEWLVAKQLGAILSPSRVQKGYDMIGPDGRKIQVRYLANPSAVWRNEHHVRFTVDMDDYAVVFYEEMELRAVFVFRKETLGAVCSKLK